MKTQIVGLVAATLLVGPMAANAMYWSLFNAEGESSASAVYVTYATLGDMLSDANRLGTFFPNGFGAGRNVVGSGSDEFVEPETPVPEPGSLALLGLGLAGLGLSRRRKA